MLDLLLFPGGAKGSRTPDLWYARPVLYQLSYGPSDPGTRTPVTKQSIPSSEDHPVHRFPYPGT